MEIRTGSLEVSGAVLRYEIQGKGPLLLLIAGANGDGLMFRPIAQHLAERYSVVTYAGFSQSVIGSPPVNSERLAVDADDVKRVIDHLGQGPSYVFGNSSGAIVALQALISHPEAIKKVIVHEPPLLAYQPSAEKKKWTEFFQKLDDIYNTAGLETAMGMFVSTVSEVDAQGMSEVSDPRLYEYAAPNVDYWFKHELNVYPQSTLDIEALKSNRAKLVLGLGLDSQDDLTAFSTRGLAEILGMNVTSFPGGHVGFYSRPDEFSKTLNEILPR